MRFWLVSRRCIESQGLTHISIRISERTYPQTAASTPSSTLSGQCSPADLIALKCAALEAMGATRGMAAKLEIFKVSSCALDAA